VKVVLDTPENNKKRIMKLYQITCAFASAIVLLTACHSTKKISTAISKKDTVAAVVLKKNPEDSAAVRADIVKKVQANRVNFSWFNAKIKVDYEGSSGNNKDATANIRIQKDSVIWISLTGLLGIEGFRVMVTKDSVKVMNKLDKEIQYRSIAYLQELTQLPFDYYTLQDMILGNPIYFSNNIVSFKQADNQMQIQSLGKLFKHFLTLDTTNNQILHSKLDDIDTNRNRTADITFGDYDASNGRVFSKDRQITVTEKSKLDIHLDFKQYDFDQPQTFPFNVPKNYKVK
jgi:hypothetical protein